MFKPTIFREYDIRGAADVELLDDDVEQLGRAFGTYLQRHQGKRISLGRDTRLSSPRLRDALMRGLKASGSDVIDIGVVPTPVWEGSGRESPGGWVGFGFCTDINHQVGVAP